MIRTIIIDDEPHAREELKYLLQEHPEIEIVAECANALEGIRQIHSLRPDLLFLDVQMPAVDGFEMLTMLERDQRPHLIFVTAYDEYAIRAFEADAIDYLLKPVEPERLKRAIEKVASRIQQGDSPEFPVKSIHRIPCALKNIIRLVPVQDVVCVRCDATGVHVVTKDKELLTDLTLKTLQEGTDLFQVHRQYLVNLDVVDEIRLLDGGNAEIITRCGITVPVSRRFLKELKEAIGM